MPIEISVPQMTSSPQPVNSPKLSDEAIEHEVTWVDSLKALVPSVVSLLVHTLVLLVLALVTLEDTTTQIAQLIAIPPPEEVEDPPVEIELDPEIDVVMENFAVFSAAPAPASASAAATAPTLDQTLVAKAEVSQIRIEAPTTGIPDSIALIEAVPDGEVKGEARDIVDSYQQALDRLAQELIWMLDKGPVLAVWCFDQSGSMKDDQKEIRDRIETVVSSSKATTALLEEQGFEVKTLNEVGELDVYIDGADECNKRLHLIKGGGGALTREKVLAAAARRFICIVDESKFVGILGTFPLPIEVLPMANELVSRQLLKMRVHPVWREGFITDNGNHILDIHDLQIANPIEMEARINKIPGVVSVGIFADRGADILLIADDDGVRELRA